MGKMSLWFATIRGALPSGEFEVGFEAPGSVIVRSRHSRRSVVLRLDDVDGQPPARVVDLLRIALTTNPVPGVSPVSSTSPAE